MNGIQYKRFVLINDDFYSNPQGVYRAALEAEYHEHEHVTGLRSTTVYHEPGIRARLQRILGLRITRWDTDPALENGVFYMGLSEGKKKETPGVHFDLPFDDITVVVYLTPGLPVDSGTSHWMHKATGLTDPPTARDARRLGRGIRELRELLERDTKHRDRWVEVDRIGYRTNRMVAYASGMLHSATRHYGSSLADGRVYQTFRIGVDWTTFKRA